MYAAICDDEKECIEHIEKCLAQLQGIYHDLKWKTFGCAEEVLEFYKRNGNKFDILITDIEMKDVSGVELANAIRSRDGNVIIFFLTGHTEYAIQCFRAEPMNFWVKPVSYDIIKEDFGRAKRRIMQDNEYITITENRQSNKIKYCDIVYLEKSDRKTIIHTKEYDYKTNKSLSEFQKELSCDNFVRIYQTYIVNLAYVKSFTEKIVELKGRNELLPVGRTYMEELKRALIRYKERRLLGKMNIYDAADLLTGFFEAYFLYLLFETFLKKRKAVNKNIYYLMIIITAVIINVSNIVFSSGVLNLMIIIITAFLYSFIYEGKLKARMILSALGIMVAAITEVITLFGLSLIFDEQVNILIENKYFRLMGIVISKMLGYISVRYITYRANKELQYMNTSYWLLFFFMFFSTTLTMCTFCRILEEGASDYVRRLIIVCACGLNVMAIAIVYIYERTLKQNDTLTKQQLSQMQLTNQVKHYSALMMSQEQLRATKHDLKNHLLSIKAKIDKTEYGQALEYINSMLEQTGNASVHIDTGNTVLDAILSVKKEEAEKKGIDFKMNLRIPADLPIDDADICVIFGNALDNAIEACERVEKNAYISAELVYGEDTLLCKIENSCTESKDLGSHTSKKDLHNHGIGKMNIERALEKYTNVCKSESMGDRYIFSVAFMNLDKR